MLGILQKKVDETYREFRHNYKRKKSEEPQLQPSKLGMGIVGVNSLLGLLLINAPWWETKIYSEERNQGTHLQITVSI